MRWFLLMVAVAGAGSPAGAQPPASMIEVRQLYLEAVEEEDAIARGLQATAEIRATGAAPPGSAHDALLAAYEGAFVTLRAKHGFWPPDRLRHLRDGLALMDDAVAARPDHAEIRYLRLLSCYFLPGILGRGPSVREDFDALARLLPSAATEFPPALYSAMVGFVLDHGRLQPHQRAPLEAARASIRDG